MNRRNLVLATLAAGSMPVLAAAQTPFASPTHDESTPADTRALDLVELVRALQSMPVDNDTLGDARAVPWTDFGDTDLYSSLGGAVIVAGNGDIHDTDTVMHGAYIVYESAEIAYQEFVRKLGSAYDIPSTTMSMAGTTVWELGNDTMRTGVTRISYVMLLANLFDTASGAAMDVIIDHLVLVAARLDA
jgi:hypothetical protein